MSVETEYQRILTAKSNIKTAIEGKGVTVPSTTKIDGYPSLIDSIPTGGGGSSKILNKLNGRTIIATDFTGYASTSASFTYTYEFSEQPIMGTILLKTGVWGASTSNHYGDPVPNTTYHNFYRFHVFNQDFTLGVTNVSEDFAPSPNLQSGKVITSVTLDHRYGLNLTLSGNTISLQRPADDSRIMWHNETETIVIGYKFSDGSYDFDTFFVQQCNVACFVKGTKITLADGTRKNVEELDYNDDVVVWNFDNGKSTSTKPLWITKSGLTTDSYTKVTLSDGTILNLCGSQSHRLLCLEDGKFAYAVDMVGKHTFKQNGMIVEVVSTEIVNEQVEFYNVITDYHMNLYANGILTSCRYSNLYPIKDIRHSMLMKYEKDGREIIPFEAYEGKIDRKWYDGLRLGEQTIPVEETIKYIERLEALKK